MDDVSCDSIGHLFMKYFNRLLSKSPSVASLMNQDGSGSASYRGRLHPDGRVTVGRVPRRKILKADEEYETSRAHYSYGVRSHWHYERGLVEERFVVEEKPCSLGLASVNNYHKLSPRKNGLKGITPLGRNNVRSAAYLLQRHYGRKLGFYTLTCPYTDVESIYLFNQNIAYIQRSYFQELRRAYQRMGSVFSYVAVLEFQPTRFDSDGIPALHIHYCAPCYVSGTWDWILTASQIRAIWGRACFNAIGLRPDTNASVDAAVVRSSAAGYLSKYMSKGGETYSFLAQCAPDQFPSQWWSCSKNLKEAIKATTVELPEPICGYVIYNNTDNPKCPVHMVSKRLVYIFCGGQEMCVGLSGRMSDEVADSLRPHRLFFCLGELL